MKKIITISILFLASILLSGCIEVEMLINVNKDGSGTIEEKVLLSSSMIDMMNSFMMMGDSDTANTFDIYDEEELRESTSDYGEGVSFASGEKLSDNGREGFLAIYKFADINKIQLDEDVAGKMPADMSMDAAEEKKFVKFKFKKGSPAELTILLPPKNADEKDFDFGFDNGEADGENSEMTEEMKQMLSDFGFAIKLNVNGKIEKTDALHVDGNQITLLEMNFGELMSLPDKFDELKMKQPKNLEEVQEILKDIPGFKFELKEKIKVKFK